jgi:peptide chain release factor 2
MAVETTDIKNTLADLKGKLEGIKSSINFEEKKSRVEEIEGLMGKADFWDSPDAAQKLIDEMKKLKLIVVPVQESETGIRDSLDLLELAEAEDDSDTVGEVELEVAGLSEKIDSVENQSLLSGVNDDKDVFFSVHAGAGGNDACECAELMLRMYIRFFERKGYKVEELVYTPGEEAGIRGVTLLVKGEFAYGNLRSEIGVHRIVRISPFSGKRETSFVGIDVMPEYEDIEIDIDENDLRVDTYRSSGKGGQHVNKTDSAVRLTHLPTGIVVAVQNERSQHKNKAMALKLLKSKIQRMEDAKRQKELGELYSEKGEIAFGSQIRNYVFQPYTQVKDSRTGHENGDVQKVMDGDIDGFINAYLHYSTEKKN